MATHAVASSAAAKYERHRPEDTLLYETIQAHWRTFLTEIGPWRIGSAATRFRDRGGGGIPQVRNPGPRVPPRERGDMKGTVGAGELGPVVGIRNELHVGPGAEPGDNEPAHCPDQRMFTADAFHDVKLAFDAALKPVFVRSSVKPERILHFTDASGLLAILRDRRVWLGALLLPLVSCPASGLEA